MRKKPTDKPLTFITNRGVFSRETEEAAAAMVQHFAETFNKHHPGESPDDDLEYPNED